MFGAEITLDVEVFSPINKIHFTPPIFFDKLFQSQPLKTKIKCVILRYIVILQVFLPAFLNLLGNTVRTSLQTANMCFVSETDFQPLRSFSLHPMTKPSEDGSPKSIIMQGRFRKIKNFIYYSQKQ